MFTTELCGVRTFRELSALESFDPLSSIWRVTIAGLPTEAPDLRKGCAFHTLEQSRLGYKRRRSIHLPSDILLKNTSRSLMRSRAMFQ